MWWIYRKITAEWRIAWMCGGFLVGVSLVLYTQVAASLGFLAAVLSIFSFLNGRFYATALLFLGMVGVGLGYGSGVYKQERSVYVPLIGHQVAVTGYVKEDATTGPSGATSLQLGSVQIRGSPYGGSVFVSSRLGASIPLRGDEVTFTGIAEEGFGNFSITLKNAQLTGIHRQQMRDPGRLVRDWFASRVRMVIDEPQASLGIGYLTGQKSSLPDDLTQALKVAGLTHIVVASGYNLTILVRLARKAFLRVSKFSAAMAALGMVTLFMAMTGLSPSMTRAGIVSGLSVLFWYYGRKVHPLILLVVVAAATAAYQPSYTWGDLGWQLSFGAFFGVMIIGPLLQRYFYGDKPPGIVRQTLGETIAAHIATVPIIALQFGVVSNVAIIANLLVVPLVPLAMLLTFVCGLWGAIGLGFSDIVAMPTQWLLEYMIAVARYVSEIKWAQGEISYGVLFWLVYLIITLGACWWMWRASRYNLRTGDALAPQS